MSVSIAIRLDFERAMLGNPELARSVAAVLARACFSSLERLSGRRMDKWFKHVAATPGAIAEYALSPDFDAICLETRRGKKLKANSELDNGLVRISPEPHEISLPGRAVIPLDFSAVDDVVTAVGELGALLGARTGFAAAEPNYEAAHRVVIGLALPKARDGLSDERRRARRARDWKREQLVDHVASIEWLTLLGPDHLAKVDLPAVCASGVFHRVHEISPQLVMLQLTADPLDDLSGELEKRLPAARDVLASLLVDISDVTLE